MPRIRSIKPEFWADFPTARLSRDARLLYIGLWNFADEHGRLAGDPRFVKGQVFPYDDDLHADAVTSLLEELQGAGKVRPYTVDGAPYLHLPRLSRHQRLEPAKVPSRFPEPPTPDGPGRSERRADVSARDSAPQPVENHHLPGTGEFPQVTPPASTGADESARGADESSLLYGTGSMEQAASGREDLPPPLQILRSKLNTRRLTVRWDKLTPDQVNQIIELIDLHGDTRLVDTALRAFRSNNPPVYAQAWLGDWLALPKPGESLRLAPEPTCTLPGHQGTTRACVQCASEQKAATR